MVLLISGAIYYLGLDIDEQWLYDSLPFNNDCVFCGLVCNSIAPYPSRHISSGRKPHLNCMASRLG